MPPKASSCPTTRRPRGPGSRAQGLSRAEVTDEELSLWPRLASAAEETDRDLAAWGFWSKDVPRAQAPLRDYKKKKKIHVFNVYKGKERTVPDSRAIFCTIHMAGLRGKGKRS